MVSSSIVVFFSRTGHERDVNECDDDDDDDDNDDRRHDVIVDVIVNVDNVVARRRYG
jgi:hypothetical protein